MERVELIHGDGGKYTLELINDIFYKNFRNDILLQGIDSGVFSVNKGTMALTTDSFIVQPLFFRGGDIGRLSICGTINDLVVCGAKPLYLSASFIIEEGFPIKKLEEISLSMAKTCEKAKVKIITGDTKVVEKGKADGIFINTTGVGFVDNYNIKRIEEGDAIIVTGSIAEHGTAIAVDRYNLDIKGDIKSDCMPLNHLLEKLLKYKDYIKLMRDPTRGGIGQALNDICKNSGLGIALLEGCIPIREEVKWVNEMIGIDPLYLASEGRMLIICCNKVAEEIKSILVEHLGCQDAEIIGRVTNQEKLVCIENSLGGKRILGDLDFQMLPRIC